MKVTNLIVNILTSLLAFSFAGTPLAIGTVGSLLSLGGARDGDLSRISFTNLFGALFVVSLSVAILVCGIIAFAKRKKVSARYYTTLEGVTIGLSFLSSIITFLLYRSLEDLFEEGAVEMGIAFSVMIAIPTVVALIMTIVGAASKPNQAPTNQSYL